MPGQKAINCKAQEPRDIRFLFALAESLTNEGWGVTLVSNHQMLQMNTNAPASYVDLFAARHAHILDPNHHV